MTRAAGPRFHPLGEQNGVWHDLEITVTPEGVTARWNGQSCSISTAQLESDIATDVERSTLPAGALPRGFRPKFDARGGLGLYVRRGSASFRAVTVTPLR